jgi:hypothetical protein
VVKVINKLSILILSSFVLTLTISNSVILLLLLQNAAIAIMVGYLVVTQDLVILYWDLHNYKSCDNKAHNEYIVVMASSLVVDRPCALKILGFTLGTILEMRVITRGFPRAL